MNAIEIESLAKSYRDKRVLHDLTFAVPAGTRFGFLGPNGAGKTTAIRILLGLLRADGGTARIFGKTLREGGPALRESIGYLPGEVRFHTRMTGRATLAFIEQTRGVDCRAEAERLSRVFELDRDLDKRVRNYSSGMKQKLGLIQALMHKPQLLILDEPTTALDPLIREKLYRELRTVTDQGRTVLFSSHTLSEVEALCDEVAILRNGRLIECEHVHVLQQRAVRRVELVLAAPLNGDPQPPAALQVVQQEGLRWRGTWTGAVDETLFVWLAQLPVRDVAITPPSLEDLFLTYYQQELQAADTEARPA